VYATSDRSGLAQLDVNESKQEADTECIRGYARFLDGLACLEDIDAEVWFNGSKVDAYPHIEAATAFFDEAQQKLHRAYTACGEYQEWLPPEERAQVEPDREAVRQAAELVAEIVAALRMYELPTLGQVHTASGLMRTELLLGERRSVEMRGTFGHFPVGSP
jgi:hypothetical protein